jgi:hypothetical protein
LATHQLESAIVSSCLEFLAWKGIEAWRQNQGAIPIAGGGYRRFTGKRGLSDIIGILDDGRWLAVEAKLPGNKPTADQDGFLDMIFRKGGVATWVTSVTELEADLREAGVL